MGYRWTHKGCSASFFAYLRAELPVYSLPRLHSHPLLKSHGACFQPASPLFKLMYTVESLECKSLKELKAIACDCGIVPSGDRRCRQNWIEAIAGVNPPLLQLLEISPAAEVEQAQEAIEVQFQEPPSKFDNCWVVDAEGHFVGFLPATADEYLSKRRSFAARPGDRVVEPGSVLIKPIEIQRQEPIESKFGRIVYPLFSKSIASVENSPGVDRDEAALPIALVAENSIDAEAEQSGIALSARFLALYSPPQPERISYKADADGQLSLLDFEIQSEPEPPDPDDFDSMFAFWAAYDAWDEAHPEPLEVSLASMCEWAPCPEEWFLPDTNETTVSRTLEISPVSIFSSGCANESSSTSDFFIPVFGAAADRSIGNDEPPTAGVGARLPKPKPPSFPPVVEDAKRCPCGAMPAAQCDGTTATHIYPDRIVFTPCYKQLYGIQVCGRAPPGGDAMQQ